MIIRIDIEVEQRNNVLKSVIDSILESSESIDNIVVSLSDKLNKHGIKTNICGTYIVLTEYNIFIRIAIDYLPDVLWVDIVKCGDYDWDCVCET